MLKLLRYVAGVVAVLLVACGGGVSEEPIGDTLAPPPGQTVQLTLSHRLDGATLWLEGDTDLPDGANVSYQVTHEYAATEQAPEGMLLMESSHVAVSGGRYSTSLSLEGWPAGDVRLFVAFPLPPQPEFIVERFGGTGENLAGDNVTAIGTFKSVEVVETIQFNPES
jgi:hypothetical protein